MATEIEEETVKMQCISMLYALVYKFGDEISKKKLKEVIVMRKIDSNDIRVKVVGIIIG